MTGSGETQHYIPAHERSPGTLFTAVGVLASLALGAGGAAAYRQYEQRQTQVATGLAHVPEKTEIFIPLEETEGIQTLYICTIENPDGSVSTVEINISGPEDAVEVAKILAGQTGNAAGILLDGINSYNARYGSNIAMLVGNDLEVLNVSKGIGASALTSTQHFGLKQEVVGMFVHNGEAAADTTVLAP